MIGTFVLMGRFTPLWFVLGGWVVGWLGGSGTPSCMFCMSCMSCMVVYVRVYVDHDLCFRSSMAMMAMMAMVAMATSRPYQNGINHHYEHHNGHD